MQKLTIDIIFPDERKKNMFNDDFFGVMVDGMNLSIISDDPEKPIFIFSSHEGLMTNWSCKEATEDEAAHYSLIFDEAAAEV